MVLMLIAKLFLSSQLHVVIVEEVLIVKANILNSTIRPTESKRLAHSRFIL